MLPFLQPKKMAGMIIAKRKGGDDVITEEGEMDQGLMSAAEDLISAVHAKDAKAVAMALEAAMSMSDEDEQI